MTGSTPFYCIALKCSMPVNACQLRRTEQTKSLHRVARFPFCVQCDQGADIARELGPDFVPLRRPAHEVKDRMYANVRAKKRAMAEYVPAMEAQW